MSAGALFDYPNTEAECLIEARKRLGPSARVHRNDLDFRAPCRITAVRYAGLGTRRVVVARGLTWARAIYSLDARAARGPRRAPRRPRKKPRGPIATQESLAL